MDKTGQGGGNVDGWCSLLMLLPEPLKRTLQRLPSATCGQVQELRLRAGQAVALGIRGAERYVTAGGVLTVQPEAALCCDSAWLQQVMDCVCQQSIYAHQEELKHGFLTASNGCRIGIAGTAVVEKGTIVSYRCITSLCLRVSRGHHGCAAVLAERLCSDGIAGALICGEPSSGKTSLLRDLAREFSARRFSIAVVDERGEIAGGGHLVGCDCLFGAPKAQGIEQAIRCLSPRVVLFDELGGREELKAVRQAWHCGVPIVTSVHCRRLEELLHRAELTEALHTGVFPYLVQLRGAGSPGEIAELRQTEVWLNENGGRSAGLFDRHRIRPVGVC